MLSLSFDGGDNEVSNDDFDGYGGDEEDQHVTVAHVLVVLGPAQDVDDNGKKKEEDDQLVHLTTVHVPHK